MIEKIQTKCFERWRGQQVWRYGPRSGQKTELRCGTVIRAWKTNDEVICSVRFDKHLTITDYSDNFLSVFDIKVLASGGKLDTDTQGTWKEAQDPEFFSMWNKVFHYIIANPDKPVVYSPIERNEGWDVQPVPQPGELPKPIDYTSMHTIDVFENCAKIGAHIRYAEEFNVDCTQTRKTLASFEAEIARRDLNKEFEDYCKLRVE